MSRLHKKISDEEKKKRRVALENVKDSSKGTSKFSGSKSATVASPLKAKPDKSLVDAKVGEPNFFQKSMEFFREVKVELNT